MSYTYRHIKCVDQIKNLFKYKFIMSYSICCFAAYASFAQGHDHNYMARFSENAGGIQLSYSEEDDSLSVMADYRDYTMTAGNPFSDKNGDLLFFSNNLHVYNKDVEIIENGEDIAVGGFLPDLYSRDTTVTFGVSQNWVTIPISDSLFYAFHKGAEISAYEFFDLDIEEDGQRLNIYSDGLYLTKIRMKPNGDLYIKSDEKQLLLVDDKLEFNQLTVCKHANGKDWYIHQPKVETADAYLIKLYADGSMEPPKLQFFSDFNGRVRSISITKTNPTGNILARFLAGWNTALMQKDLMHKLELFHFNRCTGATERFFVDSLAQAPNNTRLKDIEFSQSGRFLYIANTDNILQMDLSDENFFENRDTIAVWDGFVLNNQPAFYDDLWRLPNGKIAVNTRFSVPYLHSIHKPDNKGVACDFEARALISGLDSIRPGRHLSIEFLPNFPEYRMEAMDVACTTSVDDIEEKEILDAVVYPNPVDDLLNIDLRGGAIDASFQIVSASGKIVEHRNISEARLSISTFDYPPGIYFLVIRSEQNGNIFRTKFVKG